MWGYVNKRDPYKIRSEYRRYLILTKFPSRAYRITSAVFPASAFAPPDVVQYLAYVTGLLRIRRVFA